jgi:hypothetical protein
MESNMDDIIQTTQSVLALTPERWLSLTASLPLDLLSRPPAPGEWSAVECLQHLLDTERTVFPVRVGLFLAGLDLVAFFPDDQGSKVEQGPRELAVEFAGLRAHSLKDLAKVTPADLARVANHSELGRVTLEEMLHEWAAHDLMHTVQAERALMQPFIAASGPWRGYFKDHDVEGNP